VLGRCSRPTEQRLAAGGRDADWFTKGLQLFKDRGCAVCHAYEGKGGIRGPDLTGYGSAAWLRLMIMAPHHELRYGRRNTMPAFRDLESPAADVTRKELDRVKKLLLRDVADDDPKAAARRKEVEDATGLIHLSDVDRELIIRWLLRDRRVVFGGEPVAEQPTP
jgi:mono/diheme cytochrome c family protein